MRPLFRIGLTLLVAPIVIAIVLGWLVAPSFLHPMWRSDFSLLSLSSRDRW